MKRTEAFAKHRTKLRNVRASWSARSEDGTIVALTFWQDHFINGPDGKMIYTFPPVLEAQRNAWFVEFVKNVYHAYEHCDRTVRVVISRAKDPSAYTRQIASCDPKEWQMQINDFDPRTGAFTAVQVS